MLKIFFFLFFSCGINAQQLESLKTLKTKHDSIETQLKLKHQEEIKGKSEAEISEIYTKIYSAEAKITENVLTNIFRRFKRF